MKLKLRCVAHNKIFVTTSNFRGIDRNCFKIIIKSEVKNFAGEIFVFGKPYRHLRYSDLIVLFFFR